MNFFDFLSTKKMKKYYRPKIRPKLTIVGSMEDVGFDRSSVPIPEGFDVDYDISSSKYPYGLGREWRLEG